MSDLEHKSFDYNFAKPFIDEKDFELNCIHVSNSQLEKYMEFLNFSFMDWKTLKVLRTLSLTRLVQSQEVRGNVRLDDHWETILIKHFVEAFILPKFEDPEEFIRLNHSDGHNPFQVRIEMIQRKYGWPGMHQQVEAYLSKSDSYAEQVKLLKEWRTNPPPERSGASISIDYLILPRNSLGHTAISKIGIFIFPPLIRADRVPAFTGEIIRWITEMQRIWREFSASYHVQSMGLVEKSDQTIPHVLNKMGVRDEDWDLHLPLAQYAYNTMPIPMFEGMFSYEVLYRFRPPEFVRFTRKL